MIPPKIVILGDEKIGRQFIGPAKSQLEILLGQLKFQNLTQGIRRIRLADNIFVECVKHFDFQSVSITVISDDKKILEENIIETTYLLVVYGNAERRVILTDVIGTFASDEAVTCDDTGYGLISYASKVYAEKQVLFGSFVHCGAVDNSAGYSSNILGEDSSATGIISACLRRYYQRLYNYDEIISSSIQDIDKSLSLFSAYDIYPVGNVACSNLSTIVYDEWSKVYNDLIITVYTYKQSFDVLFSWAFTASFKNTKVNVPAISFYRTRFKRLDIIPLHIGFDIWRDEDDNYHVGAIDDFGTFYHYILNESTYTLELVSTYVSTVRDEKMPGEDGITYIRLLGYGNVDGDNIAWWGNPGRSAFYYKENLDSGEITEYEITDPDADCVLLNAVWNPVKKELLIISSVSSYYKEITADDYEFDYYCGYFFFYQPSSGGYCRYDCSGYLLPESMLGCNATIDYTMVPGKILVFYEGEYHEYSAYFRERGDAHAEFQGTVWVCELREPTQILDLGDLIVGPDIHNKGVQKLFNVGYGYAQFNAPTIPSGEETAIYDGVGGVIECRSENGKAYELQKCMWSNSDSTIVHQLNYKDQSTEEIDDVITCVWEEDWHTLDFGDEDILTAAYNEFPYDLGWSSILLHGYDQEDNEITDWVIYKNLVDGGFFIKTDTGQKYDIPSSERAFFLQHTIKQKVVSNLS